MTAEPGPNVVPFPSVKQSHAELPKHVAEELTGDPLADLSKVLLYIYATMVSSLVDIEEEKKFKAKCRELGLDPDIARKIPAGPIGTVDSAIRSLSRGMDLVTFARKQCERLAQAAAARAASPAPTPRRRRKAI